MIGVNEVNKNLADIAKQLKALVNLMIFENSNKYYIADLSSKGVEGENFDTLNKEYLKKLEQIAYSE